MTDPIGTAASVFLFALAALVLVAVVTWPKGVEMWERYRRRR